MELTQNLKSNLSNNKPVKIEYNKIQNLKPSNFFLGEKININKEPKKFSYDKTDKFYTSRVKENEIEPKLLLDKLPSAFHYKNNHNSNDSKTTDKTKNSQNEQKSNYNKLSIDYSENSRPDYKNEINIYKPKKRSEERKKINNYFFEEEMNIQKQLQAKRNHTLNDRCNNNDIIPLKIVTKNNNEFLDIKKSSTDYNKNIFIYNISNTNNNNNHLKTDLSEYEDLRPKNNLIELGYIANNNILKNSTFNTSMKEKFKISEKNLKEKPININNKKIKNIYNEALNDSDLYKNNYRKGSDSDAYPTKFTYIDNIMKKNERSGSCSNMVNSNQLEAYYSPKRTIINNNTGFTNRESTKKENENMRLSAKPLLHPIIPYRKNSQENENKKKSNIISNNIKKIKTMGKMQKMSIATDNLFNKINLDINDNKKNIIQRVKNQRKELDINEGISFKLNNGFKYYLNLRHINLYLLKEVQFNLAKGVSTSIKAWNKIFKENDNYLNIVYRKLNTPEKHFTFVIEYPKGGENIYDIITNIGLIETKLVYYIISELYKNILILKNEKNEGIKDYQNIPFCLCDLFLTINEELKIMPPVIRKIPINASKTNNNDKNKKENKLYCNICECKKNLEILSKKINISKNNISLFCLGLSFLQIITQNFLFNLKSYSILINNKKYFQCCLIHSLINIEENMNESKHNLLLLNFLSQYDNKLINFIHHCTQFEEIDKYPNSDFIDCYYMMEKKINLSMKELYKIINFNNNNYISLDNFLKNFKFLFNDMKLDKNSFKSLLHENKIIDVIKRSFNIDKNQLKNKIYKIIDDIENNNNLDYDCNNVYENFVNSGNYFFNASSLKKIENNNKKIMTIINDTTDNENKRNSFNINKNHIIFKNYNSSENNS